MAESGESRQAAAPSSEPAKGGESPRESLMTNSYQAQKCSKRKRGQPQGSDGGDGEDDADSGDVGSAPSQPARQKSKQEFSCPFRKRNPLRFNVRSHLNCATQSFPSISLVKRHIMTFHKRKRVGPSAVCRRCRELFQTDTELEDHLRVPESQICPVKDGELVKTPDDPEEGITPEIDGRLRDRTAKGQILDWHMVWGALFPQDDFAMSEDFVPVVELDEVRHALNNDSDNLQLSVREALRFGSGDCGITLSQADICSGLACTAFHKSANVTMDDCQSCLGSHGGQRRLHMHARKPQRPRSRASFPVSGSQASRHLVPKLKYPLGGHALTDSSQSVSGTNTNNYNAMSGPPSLAQSQTPSSWLQIEATSQEEMLPLDTPFIAPGDVMRSFEAGAAQIQPGENERRPSYSAGAGDSDLRFDCSACSQLLPCSCVEGWADFTSLVGFFGQDEDTVQPESGLQDVISSLNEAEGK